MGDICFKRKDSCKGCDFYRKDKGENRMSCFARQDAKKRSKGNETLEDYFTAINMDDKELAQAYYDILFKK